MTRITSNDTDDGRDGEIPTLDGVGDPPGEDTCPECGDDYIYYRELSKVAFSGSAFKIVPRVDKVCTASKYEYIHST